MANLADLIKDLMAAGTPQEIAGGLQSHAHPVYQEIFNRGHAEETKDATKKIEAKDAEIARLGTELTAAQEKAKKLEKSEPQWETKEREYQTEIADLKDKAKNAKAEAQALVLDERRKTALTELKSKLIARKVHPDYAEVLADKREVRDRVTFNDDGSRKVLQAGKAIPLSPAEGQDVLDMLSDELVAKVDKVFIMANGDHGSGTATGGGAGSGNFLKDLKARTEAERAAKAKVNNATPSLDERLKVPR